MDRDNRPVSFEDVSSVGSRISWGAILAGAVMTIATYLVLTFLFAALGLSLTDAGVRANQVGTGALIAAIVALALALFFGGWVTTQLSVGENRREAAIYGVLMWAVVTAFTLFLVSMGVRAGYMALVGGTLIGQNAAQIQQQQSQPRNWEELARDAGVPQERINEWRQATDPNRIRAEVNDPANRERVESASVVTAWSVFTGTLISIGAAITGAMVGRGGTFRLFGPMATGTPMHSRAVTVSSSTTRS
jgi:hypothetical protein